MLSGRANRVPGGAPGGVKKTLLAASSLLFALAALTPPRPPRPPPPGAPLKPPRLPAESVASKDSWRRMPPAVLRIGAEIPPRSSVHQP